MKRKLWQVAVLIFLAMSCNSFLSGLSMPHNLEKQKVDDRQANDAAADFTRPWSQRRGIESIDRNAEVILVRVPLNQLSDALAASAIETRRDVLGSEIEISGHFVFTYQIVGQIWSIMVSDGVREPGRVAEVPVPSPAQLSKQLGQPVIVLNISDTSGVIGYNFFKDGEVVEYFAGAEDESTDWSDSYASAQRYVLSPYPEDDPEAKQVAYFWSRRRQVTAKEIGSIWGFTDQFMRESDAYDPAIDSWHLLEYSIKRGGRYRVQIPSFTSVNEVGQKEESVPDLVRVDYFRFGN
jgi:hypothetical protein